MSTLEYNFAPVPGAELGRHILRISPFISCLGLRLVEMQPFPMAIQFLHDPLSTFN